MLRHINLFINLITFFLENLKIIMNTIKKISNFIIIIIIMAKNKGNGGRTGVITNRTQTYNPKTGQYVKRDETGKFIGTKETPFKSVRREENAKEQELRDKNIITK